MSTRAKRRLAAIGAGVALLAYIVAFVVFFDPSLVRLDWTLAIVLVVAAAVQAVAIWLFGELFRNGVQATGDHISSYQGFKAALVGSSVARLLPAGGAITPVAMAWAVRPHVRGTSGAALRATALNYGALLILTGAGLAVYSLDDALPDQVLAPRILAGVVLLIGVGVLVVSTRLGVVRRHLPNWIRIRLGNMIDQPVDLRSHLLVWGRLLAEVAVLGIVLTGFGIGLGPVEVATAFGVSQLAAGIPGTPGGLGFAEAGLLGSLAFFGVGASVAVAPVLVFRVVQYWLPAGAGLVAGSSSFLRSTEAQSA